MGYNPPTYAAFSRRSCGPPRAAAPAPHAARTNLSRPCTSYYSRSVSEAAPPRIRIVLVDDHPVFVKGLQALFRAEPDLEVVATCSTGTEGLVAIREHRPDIVVLDIRMPDLDGFGMLRAMDGDARSPRVILLAAEIDGHATVEAVRLGVHGIILKDMPAHLLLECVRKVHAGERWLEKKSAGRAMAGMVDPQKKGFAVRVLKSS